MAWISSTWTKNNAEKATCTQFHTHRVSRVHSRAFRREQTTQVLQSFCDHVPRALQMFPFNQPALRASFYLLRFRFCPRFAQILSQQSLEPLYNCTTSSIFFQRKKRITLNSPFSISLYLYRGRSERILNLSHSNSINFNSISNRVENTQSLSLSIQ